MRNAITALEIAIGTTVLVALGAYASQGALLMIGLVL